MLLVWIVVLALASSALGDVKSGGIAVDCPCNGDENATYIRNPNPCPPTCKNPNKKSACTKEGVDYGCECKQDYVVSPSGRCILPKDCPVKCQKNAVYKKCPNPCPGTCKYPSGIEPCTALCKEYGCEYAKKCNKNETFAACKAECPDNYCPENDSIDIIACDPPYPCESGCICKAKHLRLSQKNNRCVLASECPPRKCRRPNEEWNSCPSNCLADRCEDINKNKTTCDISYSYCRPQCVCKKGYFRNDSGICIPAKDCVKCQRNAEYKECPNPCPRTCENPSGERPCNKLCVRHGCECNAGYVLSLEGKCIELQKCPAAKECSKNETFVACKGGCPTNYCPVNDNRAQVACSPPYPCRPGCVCKGNHLRLSRSNDKCILASECPRVNCTRPNEEWNSCPKCLAESCDDINNNVTICNDSNMYCRPQCVCKKGHYRNERDICVPVKDCVKCQRNAVYKECPNPCAPTCENPSGERPCNKLCVRHGCECEPGHMLSPDGKCIEFKECPGAKKCSKNETFVACKVGCPNNYCPRDDSRAIVICDPIRPCPPGCVCEANHLRLSRTDDKCILASECPPVKCTRPNEEWNSCPSNCLAEKCEDIGKNQTDCNKRYSYCEPQCVCKKGFHRNERGICIPAIDCPGQCPIKPECRPTCAVPNPPNCLYTEPPADNIDGCQCKEGYILLEKGGNCTKIEECPDLGCNNDPNAVIKKCPQPCPSTCGAPDATPCKKMCIPVGCECKAGLILSEIEGKCIKPENCTGGNPCGPNGIFVPCKSECPNDYCPVDDSRGVIICEYPPFSPCYSGCICRLNHKRKSREDRRCITSSDCPPVNCTRQNEVWSSCPSACLRETCEFVDTKEQPCYTLVLNCQPGCVCADNYFRNDSDICISANECREINANKNVCGINEKYVSCVNTCTESCDSLFRDDVCDPEECQPGCACISGYRRDSNRTCIPESECVPFPPTCGFNEVWSDCKIVCPPQTCDSILTTYTCENVTGCTPGCNCLDAYLRNGSEICIPSEQCFDIDTCPIPRQCRPTCAVPNPPNCDYTEPPANNTDGCQCQAGSILSETDGICIKIDECPQDLGCNNDPHAVIKECPWPCPATCDSPRTIPCKKACSTGCQCSPGYILNKETGKCVLPEQCPCGNPCGVNGTFSDCGFRCPNQYCPEDDSLVQYACKPGRPCPPGCLCNENYRRLSYEDDTCVLASDCPAVNCTRPNEVWDPCRRGLAEKCENINVPLRSGDPPTATCNPGCACIRGFCRDQNDNCIPAKKCPKQPAIDN